MTPEERQAAFIALEDRAIALETTLDKYKDVLAFFFSNQAFFNNITTQLDARFVNIERQVSTLIALETEDDTIGILPPQS